MSMKLVKADNVELTIKPEDLEYESRKVVGQKYLGHLWQVESDWFNYRAALFSNIMVILAAFTVETALIILLAVSGLFTLRAHLKLLDNLDNKDMWEKKIVTRVDGDY